MQTLLILLIVAGIANAIISFVINKLSEPRVSRRNYRLFIKLVIEGIFLVAAVGTWVESLKPENQEQTQGTASWMYLVVVILLSVQILWDIYPFIPWHPRSTDQESVRRDDTFVQNDETKSIMKNPKVQTAISSIEASGSNAFLNAVRPIEEFNSTQTNRNRAAEWVRTKIEKWTEEEIRLEDYREFGVSSSNVKEFCEDVKEHLRLLCKNLENAKNTPPRLSKPPIAQRIDSSLAYRHALTTIQSRMEKELAQNEEVRKHLQEGGVQSLKKYMKNLIERIDK